MDSITIDPDNTNIIRAMNRASYNNPGIRRSEDAADTREAMNKKGASADRQAPNIHIYDTLITPAPNERYFLDPRVRRHNV